MYSDHKEKLKRHQAVKDITYIQTTVDAFALENRYAYPDTLADVKMDTMKDPWNGPYQYTRLDNAKGKGSSRKDKNLTPINTDYDLWSNGPDGKSVAPLTAQASRDDIVRANNGRFIGPAADY
ncbi:MAG: prepilin-type cleavage/methylation domain-containing protein [Pyrinomonadaceae bacterium]